MSFHALEEICEAAAQEAKGFFRAVLEDDMQERQVSEETSLEQMQVLYRAMKAADRSYDPSARSHSGFVGGDGAKMAALTERGDGICGPAL